MKPSIRKQATPAQRVLGLHREGRLPLVLRGKEFGLRELRVILATLAEFPESNRTSISQEICRRLEWVQPNGWLKERACREVLLSLQRKRLVKLPPREMAVRRKKPPRPKQLHKKLAEGFDFHTPITQSPQTIRFEFVKGDRRELLWNYLVDQYHYLGYKGSLGRTIKYLIWGDDQMLGAIGFASPVWRLKARDDLLQELGWAPEDTHARAINNFRFLILPHVRVNDLASRLLSLASEEVIVDWTWFYGLRPELIETFVAPSRFFGTSYRAANWVSLGKSQGFTKSGHSHHNSQEPKEIFLYGLTRKTRTWLQEAVTKRKGD